MEELRVDGSLLLGAGLLGCLGRSVVPANDCQAASTSGVVAMDALLIICLFTSFGVLLLRKRFAFSFFVAGLASAAFWLIVASVLPHPPASSMFEFWAISALLCFGTFPLVWSSWHLIRARLKRRSG